MAWCHGCNLESTDFWVHKEKDLQLVKEYQPQNKEVKQLRVLLHGPVRTGKSSFINSVESVLQGRITGQAFTDASQGSFTRKHTTYKIYKQPGVIYPFVFTDTMGLEERTNEGVCVEDIKLAMKGHIKEGYNFDPHSVISEDDPNYNKEPTLEDKVHVLVCVIDASRVDILSDNHFRQMREVRLAASDMGIPQVAILTKIDDACPEVKKNLRDAFKSKFLKEQRPPDKMAARAKTTAPRLPHHSPSCRCLGPLIEAGLGSLNGDRGGKELDKPGGEEPPERNKEQETNPEHRTYKIYRQPGVIYPFVFTDTMGLGKGTNEGVCVEDIKLAMKGHIKEGYNVQSNYLLN
ncbi:Interferon-induced protein 44 [Liparis tanakae]|uniref:Interferon-induced protein 44 n=1 Tax=Liparis tanakae TaxID=230148 RepID=A0A4Z2GW10_9TELE|nr:Interferon-induced protein 44 [Liparis tanakae]